MIFVRVDAAADIGVRSTERLYGCTMQPAGRGSPKTTGKNVKELLWLQIGCTFAPKNKNFKPSKTDVSIAFGTFKNLGVPILVQICETKISGCFFWLHMGGYIKEYTPT